MKALVTGAKGQLGSDLVPLLEAAGFEAVPFSSSELDISDSAAVLEAVKKAKPGLIINPAAYTKVDFAEKEKDRAYAVNAAGPENLASAAEEAGCAIVHVSTDFVFDGRSPVPEIYHRATHKCIYCTMLEWEVVHKIRVIFENDRYVAFCPFASRVAFEVWVMPKQHNPYFERISADDKMALAEVFQAALGKIYKALDDPAYNFYLHTAPCDGKDYPHFHWHIEILPRVATWAGFELSTGIEISTIQPEVAAEYLRGQK